MEEYESLYEEGDVKAATYSDLFEAKRFDEDEFENEEFIEEEKLELEAPWEIGFDAGAAEASIEGFGE